MNDETFNFHLRSGVGSYVSIPSLLQVVSHAYWFNPPAQLTGEKQTTKKFDSTPKKLYPVDFA